MNYGQIILVFVFKSHFSTFIRAANLGDKLSGEGKSVIGIGIMDKDHETKTKEGGDVVVVHKLQCSHGCFAFSS
jgi:hypothetical protein